MDPAAVRALQSGLRGGLLVPGDGGYDAARRVFNAMVDRRPALIVRCAGAGDVALGVGFARDHGLPLSVRGGGHSVAGSAVCDGGVLLDLSGMTGIAVDPDRRLSRAEAGLTLGEFDRATQAVGLATTLGVVSLTGIAGLTLGGGLGWLNGAHGLACDNLVAAEVVTADGRTITASAAEGEHPDLFWGLRGGGGNFGVVTAFTYRLHPVDTVLAGTLVYAPERAGEALRTYHAFARDADACPDALGMSGSLWLDDDGRPTFSLTACYCGPAEDGERALRPLRALRGLVEDTVRPMSYLELQSSKDASFPSGRRHYWKSGFLRHLTDVAVDVLLAHVAALPSPDSAVGFQHLTGAASRVDPAATAFPHRARQYDFLILSQWEAPADDERNRAWTRGLFDAMRPFLERGVYANNLNDGQEEGRDRVRDAYGVNYPRLAALKAAYDPANLFRLNHNIAPAAAPAATVWGAQTRFAVGKSSSGG